MTEPTPPPARHRAPRAVIAAVAVLLLAAWAGSAGLVGAARAVGRWAAGMGALEWRDSGGAWRTIGPADAARRLWGPVDAFLAPAWTEVQPGLDLADVSVRRAPNPHVVGVVVVRVDPDRWRFRVWGRPDWSAASVDTLAREAGMSLAVNAAYFAEDGPLGLVVSDGVRRQRQAKNRAAHFLVPRGTRPRVVNEKRVPLPELEQGFQGFPAIMSSGRTFSYMRAGGRGFDVWRVDRRTAGCVDREGRVVLLVTDTLTNGLSLEELATLLGGLGCVDAMAFDGGGSTGLSVRVEGHERVVANLEPVPLIVGITWRE